MTVLISTTTVPVLKALHRDQPAPLLVVRQDCRPGKFKDEMGAIEGVPSTSTVPFRAYTRLRLFLLSTVHGWPFHCASQQIRPALLRGGTF